MPSLRIVLVVCLLSSSSWKSTTSYLTPRQFTLKRIDGNLAPLRIAQNEDLAQAYQRLGEKLLKGRVETSTKDLPPPPVPPPPITTQEPPPIEVNSATETIASPQSDEVTEKASQSAENVVSETIHRAQEAYQVATQSLTDSPRQPGLVPNFFDFIRNTFSRSRLPTEEIDAFSKAKERLSILKQNTLDFFEIPTDGSALFTPKGSAIVDLIHSEKFAWYVVVALFILAVTQRQAGVEAARDDLNATVISAERKARDAAEAANQAAQGAAQAMKMTEAAIAQKAALQAEKEALEAELEKLTNEIKELRVQLNEKHIKASKAAADSATIEALEAEKAKLQAELTKKSAEIDKLHAQVKEKETKASKNAAAAATIETLQKEKAVLQETLQKMTEDIENLRSQLQEKQRKASKAASDAATIESLQEEKALLQAEVARLARISEELRTQLEQKLATASISTPVVIDKELEANQVEVEAPLPTPVLISNLGWEESTEPSPTVSLASDPTPKKGAKKKATATKTVVSKTATKATVTKSASKTAAKKDKKVEVVEEGENWKSLSLTTLKRKTVKDLTEYLESKGVSAVDAEGKPLKKSDLVDAVLSL